MTAKKAFFSISGLALFLFVASSCLSAEAEFVWAQNETHGSALYMSQFQDGRWSKQKLVLRDGNINILPALGSDSRGKHILVWVTLLAHGKSVIKYLREGKEGWNAPAVLSDRFLESMAPVILFDTTDTAWVFWSANDGDDDDIYMSHYHDGNWSRPARVNEENDVPDILPAASLDESGHVVVSWQQLQANGTYAEAVRVLSGTIPVETTVKSEKQNSGKRKKIAERISQHIPLPPFEINSRATIHYPGDRFHPFSVIKKRTDR